MSAASKSTTQSGPEVDGLVTLIDRLEKLLNGSELTEMEIESGETTLVLRKPTAFVAPPAVSAQAASVGGAASAATAPAANAPTAAAPAPTQALNAVVAPLTGLFYASPSPGAEPYVKPGAQVLAGQVIGLIEAMKLFNEIKSDRAGRVVRVVPDDGALVKAKDPLIEVEP
jgi:acetyl-CoA carboxylase biotin carboxyl carrier protein